MSCWPRSSRINLKILTQRLESIGTKKRGDDSQLDLLYRVCLNGAKQVGEVTKQGETCYRHNEIVHRALEIDGDEPVHELLIRFLGSFLTKLCTVDHTWSRPRL